MSVIELQLAVTIIVEGARNPTTERYWVKAGATKIAEGARTFPI